jgi:hypothetical protein
MWRVFLRVEKTGTGDDDPMLIEEVVARPRIESTSSYDWADQAHGMTVDCYPLPIFWMLGL